MVLGSFIRRGLGFVLALMLAITAFSCVMPCLAVATDDELGSVDSPAVGNASEQQTVNGVTVSAEGDSALIEGCSFGINDFYRAQAGSNKAVSDRYWGYNYYIGTQPDNHLGHINRRIRRWSTFPRQPRRPSVSSTTTITTRITSSVTSPPWTTRTRRAPRDSPASPNGISPNSSPSRWMASSSNFDQELDEGRYYAYIIGSDGSDVTSKASSNQVRLEFADFAQAVPPSDVQIVRRTRALRGLQTSLRPWITVRYG